MQTPEQIKNWKVVASVATVAALGVSGLAIASPGDPAETPPPIEIQDIRDRGAFTATTNPGFEIVPAPSFTMDDSFDSPLASVDTNDSPDDSPDSSPDIQDSPDDSPATTSAQDSPDNSPNDSPNDSPDDSPDDSLDSLDT